MSKAKYLLKFLRLDAGKRRRLLSAMFFVCLIRLSLSLISFKSVLRLTKRLGAARAASTGISQVSSEQVLWAVKVACRFIPGATCLTRSLVLQIFFARYGRAINLNIGVARAEDRTLKAHAWTEENGEVLTKEEGLQYFTKLATFDGEKA